MVINNYGVNNNFKFGNIWLGWISLLNKFNISFATIDTLLTIQKCFFFLQNDPHNERKSKIKYIQQCPNWYFVTKKGNVETVVNKVTKTK